MEYLDLFLGPDTNLLRDVSSSHHDYSANRQYRALGRSKYRQRSDGTDDDVSTSRCDVTDTEELVSEQGQTSLNSSEQVTATRTEIEGENCEHDPATTVPSTCTSSHTGGVAQAAAQPRTVTPLDTPHRPTQQLQSSTESSRSIKPTYFVNGSSHTNTEQRKASSHHPPMTSSTPFRAKSYSVKPTASYRDTIHEEPEIMYLSPIVKREQNHANHDDVDSTLGCDAKSANGDVTQELDNYLTSFVVECARSFPAQYFTIASKSDSMQALADSSKLTRSLRRDVTTELPNGHSVLSGKIARNNSGDSDVSGGSDGAEHSRAHSIASVDSGCYEEPDKLDIATASMDTAPNSSADDKPSLEPPSEDSELVVVNSNEQHHQVTCSDSQCHRIDNSSRCKTITRLAANTPGNTPGVDVTNSHCPTPRAQQTTAAACNNNKLVTPPNQQHHRQPQSQTRDSSITTATRYDGHDARMAVDEMTPVAPNGVNNTPQPSVRFERYSRTTKPTPVLLPQQQRTIMRSSKHPVVTKKAHQSVVWFNDSCGQMTSMDDTSDSDISDEQKDTVDDHPQPPRRSSNVTFWSMLETPGCRNVTQSQLTDSMTSSSASDCSYDHNTSSGACDVTVLPDTVATSVRYTNKLLSRLRSEANSCNVTSWGNNNNNMSLADELLMCEHDQSNSRLVEEANQSLTQLKRELSFSGIDEVQRMLTASLSSDGSVDDEKTKAHQSNTADASSSRRSSTTSSDYSGCYCSRSRNDVTHDDMTSRNSTESSRSNDMLEKLRARRDYLHQLVDRWYDKVTLQVHVIQSQSEAASVK